MKCPACLHQFTVRRGGATAPSMPKPPIPLDPPPAPKPREIELSNFGEDEGPTPLPDAAPGMIAPNPDEIDLPAPVEARPELPAPKSASRGPAIAPPKPPASPPPPKIPPRMPPPIPDAPVSISRQSGPGPDDIDLPAPVDVSRRDILDLPAPKAGGASTPGMRPLELNDDEADLLAPKDRSPQVGISLDAPDPDDLPSTGSLGDDAGSPALELDNIDVVAPKVDTPELPAPKAETTDVAPKQETHDVAFQRVSPPPPSARAEAKPAAATAAPKAKAKDKAPDAADEDEEKPKRGWGRALAAVAGVLLLLGGVGVALGMFTGFGQKLLRRGPSAQIEQQMMSARKQMADDTLGSYRKAALSLQSLVESDPKATEAAAVAAQAHLGAARLGVATELREADAILAKITDEHAADVPDYQKAKALRSMVAGNFVDARNKLGAVLANAPADAGALVYLGWTELAA
ncbi:MAG TPA: hypothetical protein VGL86_19645, partial [Polyangia bacterium]